MKGIHLHIVGSGEQANYRELANSLQVNSQCFWYGSIPHTEVQALMRKADILFFTSVAEGTPHVVLEAITNCLPIVCFDCCGQGDVVNDSVGIKIPLSSPQQSIHEFAEKIEYLYHHREVLQSLSQNCIKRQEELSWDNKAKQMITLYEKAIESHNSITTN